MSKYADVLEHDSAVFRFKVPGKPFKSIINSFQSLTQGQGHLILTPNGIRIQEVSENQALLEQTFINRIKMGEFSIKVPKGYDGLALRVDFKSLVDGVGVSKDTYLIVYREAEKKQLGVTTPANINTVQNVPIFSAKLSEIDINDSWEEDRDEPQVVIEAQLLKSVFSTKKVSGVNIDLFPKGIVFIRWSNELEQKAPFGEVPDEDDDFVEDDCRCFLHVDLEKVHTRCLGELCKINDGTLRLYINPQVDHFKMVSDVGALCEVVVYFFGNFAEENED